MADKPENIDIAATQLKKSLESTIKGLSIFVDSLEKSGFRKSIPAYNQMYSVLVLQKLWSNRNCRKELQPLWDQVARQSGYLYYTMKPLVGIMDGLRIINRLESIPQQTSDEQKFEAECQSIMEILSRPQSFSILKLSRLLDKGKENIKEMVKPFVEQGIIEKRGRGNGLSYCLRAIENKRKVL